MQRLLLILKLFHSLWLLSASKAVAVRLKQPLMHQSRCPLLSPLSWNHPVRWSLKRSSYSRAAVHHSSPWCKTRKHLHLGVCNSDKTHKELLLCVCLSALDSVCSKHKSCPWSSAAVGGLPLTPEDADRQMVLAQIVKVIALVRTSNASLSLF